MLWALPPMVMVWCSFMPSSAIVRARCGEGAHWRESQHIAQAPRRGRATTLTSCMARLHHYLMPYRMQRHWPQDGTPCSRQRAPTMPRPCCRPQCA